MTVEPRVEDLLASIRKAIDDDLGGASSTSGNSQGTLMRGALREMRVSYDGDNKAREAADSEIAKLRDRIGRSRIQSAIAAPHSLPPRFVNEAPPPPRPARNGFSSILAGEGRTPPPALRQTIADDELYEQLEAEPVQEFEEPYTEEIWAEPAPAYVPPPPAPYYPSETYSPPPLVSPETAYQAQNSFQELADSLMARATGERGIENMTQDLLRGMLKNWLDDNLPDLVERLVREEIERVARRGR